MLLLSSLFGLLAAVQKQEKFTKPLLREMRGGGGRGRGGGEEGGERREGREGGGRDCHTSWEGFFNLVRECLEHLLVPSWLLGQQGSSFVLSAECGLDDGGVGIVTLNLGAHSLGFQYLRGLGVSWEIGHL